MATDNRPRYGSMKKHVLFFLAKKINLLDFIEEQTGHDFHKIGRQYRCLCPLHEEKTPSFFAWKGSDDVWAFKCYGCGRKGTIIDFCLSYFKLEKPVQALSVLAEKSEISDDVGIAEMLEAITVKIDSEQRLDGMHFVACNNCRRLLRAHWDDGAVRDWVKNAYKTMNTYLDTNNVEMMEQIGQEAYTKLINMKRSADGAGV